MGLPVARIGAGGGAYELGLSCCQSSPLVLASLGDIIAIMTHVRRKCMSWGRTVKRLPGDVLWFCVLLYNINTMCFESYDSDVLTTENLVKLD